MPVQNFHGDTFVAFLDISGFKELMKNDLNALNALNIFYQAGYNVLRDEPMIQGFFVSKQTGKQMHIANRCYYNS